MAKVLIGCEESGIVRDEFRKLGHDAWSCDTLPCSGDPKYHLQMDVFEAIKLKDWDLGIFHPPCQFLSLAGNSWYYHPEDKHLPVEQRRPHPRFPDRRKNREEAVEFFKSLYNADIPRICVENPLGTINTLFKKPTQYVHPYFFGDPHSKRTGLWLKNLPELKPTKMVEPEWYYYKDGRRDSKWHVDTLRLPKEERSCLRSKTFPGLAREMARQFGSVLKGGNNSDINELIDLNFI